MKKSLYYELSHYFGTPQPLLPGGTTQPALHLQDSEVKIFQKHDELAFEQEFDGRYGYLYLYEFRLKDTICCPLRVDIADIHVLYVLSGKDQVCLLDKDFLLICNILPGRARYFHLPIGEYYVSIPKENTEFFGFYFDGQIFRDGNEQPYNFLSDLLQDYRSKAQHATYSIDFQIGPQAQQFITYFIKHLKKEQLDTEHFILEGIIQFLFLAKDDINNEYDHISYSEQLAQQAHRLVAWHVEQSGQNFNLSSIAALLNRSQAYINTVHKKHYHETLEAFKNKLVLVKAKRYLMQGLPVKNTAYLCEFNTPSIFCKFFKRMTGQTTSTFLTQHRNSSVLPKQRKV